MPEINIDKQGEEKKVWMQQDNMVVLTLLI